MKVGKQIPDPFLKKKIEHITESIANVLDNFFSTYTKLKSIEVYWIYAADN